MNFSNVMLVIEKILTAQTDQELALILDDYPTLANPETLEAMREAAAKGSNDNRESLKTAAEKVLSFIKDRSRWSKTNINTQILWAITARKCLAWHQPEFLNEAINQAEGEMEIIVFLQAFASLLAKSDGDLSKIDSLADRLIPRLKQENRREESLTVNLFYLDTRVSLLESYRKFPVYEKEEMKNLGITACRQAIQIADKLNDKLCQGFYSARLADFFRYSHQPFEAEEFYHQALLMYRVLASQEPKHYNRRLALTLSCLGVVQISLEKLPDAEISITEAAQLYHRLAEKEPQLFMEKLAIAENNLNAVKILQHESANEEI